MDVAAIDALLPQTQCRQCGFAGCRPYAQAIATGEAPINRCPPGGVAGIQALAQLTGRPIIALDPACGVEEPRTIAWIDPQLCIGCTKCILACPVDAIAGANKHLHGVIEEWCTGCKLCLPPCPVDCIVMRPADPGQPWSRAHADQARSRMQRRDRRLGHEPPPAALPLAAPPPATTSDTQSAQARRRARVASAIEEARARLARHPPAGPPSR